MLIHRALNRYVPGDALPVDVGAVVCNVSTMKAIADAVCLGMPLIERVVTVSGRKITRPGNYLVKIGTSIRDILEYCGVVRDEDTVIKLGGPMMCTQITNLDVPLIKCTNGIIAIEIVDSKPTPCIRCGRCTDACPMRLLPLYFAPYAENNNRKGMIEKYVIDCIECGCCDYICPSKIQIRKAIRIGKRMV